MKKILLKQCKKQIIGKQREKSMLVIGHEMFEKKETIKDVPMYNIRDMMLTKK